MCELLARAGGLALAQRDEFKPRHPRGAKESKRVPVEKELGGESVKELARVVRVVRREAQPADEMVVPIVVLRDGEIDWGTQHGERSVSNLHARASPNGLHNPLHAEGGIPADVPMAFDKDACLAVHEAVVHIPEDVAASPLTRLVAHAVGGRVPPAADKRATRHRPASLLEVHEQDDTRPAGYLLP